MPRALPLMAAGPFCRGAHAVGRQACLARPLLSSSACSRIYRTRLQVTAVASAEPSTVKIITQGRHVEVTDSLKSYVVGLQLRPLLTASIPAQPPKIIARVHGCPCSKSWAFRIACIVLSQPAP